MTSHRLLYASLCLFVLASFAAGGIKGERTIASPSHTTSNDLYRPFLINNVFNYYSNNGDGSFNKFSTDNVGFEIFKGDGKNAIYEDGIVWGGYHKGRAIPKVGGSVYRHGLQAGPIVTNGTLTTDPVAAPSDDPAYRVYRVRPDVNPSVAFADVQDKITNEEVSFIGRFESYTAQQIYEQYIKDWNEWPAALGGPYTDVDKNGTYDPTKDIPGQPGADQTLWYVANDCSQARVTNLSGSPLIGLEMQRTVWGYRLTGPLGNTIFTRTLLINKSGAPIDTMYLVQWSDPDLGDAGDDYVGCDSALSLAYVYNSKTPDAVFGVNCPAAGFDFLQGPMVHGSPSDTAIFNFAYRPGFKNLSMSAFVLFSQGYVPYVDPIQGVGGDIQWYHLMQGTIASSGNPFLNPLTGQPTKFTLSGDPVAGTGWVDGNPLPAADRRMCMVTGPFTMAAGDTQELVVASLASRGADRLSSITALKEDDRVIQQAYRSLNGEIPPALSYSIARLSNQATISFRADARNLRVSGVTLNLKTYGDVPVASVTLADDGLHDDGAVGDGVFGGSVLLFQQQVGLQAEGVIAYQNGHVLTWPHSLDNISTAKIAVASHAVASDNINNDGIANPGENVRYVFSLTNSSALSFSNLTTTAGPASAHQQLSFPSLSGFASSSLSYDENDPSTYLAFDVPGSFTDLTFPIILVTADTSHNVWRDTLVFPVKPLTQRLYNTPLAHAAGKADGEFSILIVDSALVKNHLYVIRGTDNGGSNAGYTLKDSTTGVVLIPNHPLPDVLGHTSPVVDGFKILRGSIDTSRGMKSWSIPSGTRRFSSVNGMVGLGLEGFWSSAVFEGQDRATGTIGMAGNFQFGGIGTTLTAPGYHNVLLKLAAVAVDVTGELTTAWNPLVQPADTNYSRAYRWLRAVPTGGASADPMFTPWIINWGPGYVYQDYNYSVPFSAWDMETNPPTRLSVGMFENNVVGGRIDGRYWPVDASGTVDNTVAREFCFIFGTPYSPTSPNPALSVANLQNAALPMMWVMTCARRAPVAWVNGDQFAINAIHPPSSLDVWTFNPSILTSVGQGGVPSSFALLQNYPNPFNPLTTIRYELAVPGRVTMKIYNILGQEVRTLVDGMQNAGQQVLTWNSRNDAGNAVASGVYFYRLTAVASHGDAPFIRTMKMLVVR